MKWVIAKIKNYGVAKAINALDFLEPYFAIKLEQAKAEVQAMDSNALSKYLIDQVQVALREHFNIK